MCLVPMKRRTEHRAIMVDNRLREVCLEQHLKSILLRDARNHSKTDYDKQTISLVLFFALSVSSSPSPSPLLGLSNPPFFSLCFSVKKNFFFFFSSSSHSTAEERQEEDDRSVSSSSYRYYYF